MIRENSRTFSITSILLLATILLAFYLKEATENAIGTNLRATSLGAVSSHYKKDIVTTGRWIEKSAYPITRQLSLFKRGISARVDFPPKITDSINIPSRVELDEHGRLRLAYYPAKLKTVKRYVGEAVAPLQRRRIVGNIADGWKIVVNVAGSIGERIMSMF